MGLNIEDPEVDRLADEVATRMGHHNKTRAIREALRAQLTVLETRSDERADRLLEVLRTEIWPLLPDRGTDQQGRSRTDPRLRRRGRGLKR